MQTEEKRSFLQKLKKIAFKKRTMAIVVVLILVGIGIFQWQRSKNNSEYLLEAASVSSITEFVSETGNITTAGATAVYSTTTGIVDGVFVENGTSVKRGEKLFSVKSTATKQQKDSALSSYMTAKNALETAKATELSLQAAMFGKWDSFKELAEGDEYEESDGTPKADQRNLAEFHVPEKEWLSAEAAYKTQQQVVAEKSVAVSAAWQAYQSTQDSTVVAVIDGEIQNLGVTLGDQVVVPTGNTVTSTAPALVLVNDEVPSIIKIQVNETDVLKVQAGQKANIEFDAIDSQMYSGVVDRVDSIASQAQDIVQFSVYIRLEDEASEVQRGMTADVDIIVSNKENVLTVPSSAVKPYQGGRAVRVVGDNGEVEFIPVEVGARGNGRIEILSGITEGTEVIVSLANEQVERSGSFF